MAGDEQKNNWCAVLSRTKQGRVAVVYKGWRRKGDWVVIGANCGLRAAPDHLLDGVVGVASVGGVNAR